MRLAVLAAILGAVASYAASAQLLPMGGPASASLVQKVAAGSVDWGNQVFLASGEGLMPAETEEPNRSKAESKGKALARTRAVANLLTTVNATPVNYVVTAGELVSQDDSLRQAVENLLRAAEVGSDKRRQEGGDLIIEVTAIAPMFGPMGPGGLLLNALAQKERLGQVAAPVRVDTPGAVGKLSAPPNQKGPFSGLIVDARGYRIDKAINPRLRMSDGSEFWGGLKRVQCLVDQPTACYAVSIEDAKRAGVAGRNPLVIRATGRAGANALCDAVISESDAQKIIAEDKPAGFLSSFKVVFVVDPSAD